MSGPFLPILLLEFLGDEPKGSEDQTASSSSRADDYTAVPVPGFKPSLRLTVSKSGRSTTDDFILHF